ncbi:MAG: LytTR family DNA-binding domain-containing protein [Chitinophagaceae bacterium]
MITALIVDDDAKNIRILRGLLEEFCPQIRITGEANSVDEAMALIKNEKPALVFLDIEMPYGSGFELLDQLMPVDFEVIFITAYDNYAIKAIKYCALDYLLKPVNIKELLLAVKKVADQVHSKDTRSKLKMFFDHFKPKQTELQKIAVPTMEGLMFLDMKEIVRCEAKGSYTQIFLLDGKKITTTQTIKELEESLPETIFFRVHNSHMVNLNYIKKYFRGRGGYIVMEDDTNIEVASRRKDSFLEKFK